MSKDRQDLARCLLQHSADDAPHEPLSPEAQAWARVRVLEAALDAIMSLENVDAANDMEGTRDFWDGVDTGLSACRDIARKALGGVE